MASAWRNFKKKISRPLFTIIFRPKIVILGADSILRVKTMVVKVFGVGEKEGVNLNFI
jgi:hypothetical protein